MAYKLRFTNGGTGFFGSSLEPQLTICGFCTSLYVGEEEAEKGMLDSFLISYCNMQDIDKELGWKQNVYFPIG